MRISTKIYLLVGFLGIVAGLIGTASIIAMRTYDAQVTAITAASTRALLGERINGAVNAIVMEFLRRLHGRKQRAGRAVRQAAAGKSEAHGWAARPMASAGPPQPDGPVPASR